MTLCGHKCCASAFKAEEVYLCAREAEAKAAAAEANANLLSLVEDMAAAGLAMKEEVEQAHERADVAGEVGAGVEVALSVEEAKNEFLGNILTNVLEALDKKEAEAAVEVEEARVRTQAAEQQARAAAREARSFLKEFVVVRACACAGGCRGGVSSSVQLLRMEQGVCVATYVHSLLLATS